MKKLLLHVHDAPSAMQVINSLKKDYKISMFFYNPNIHPKEEFNKRLKDVKKVADMEDIELFIHDHDDDTWFEKTEGHDKDPEGGERCELCFDLRLSTSALFAKDNKFKMFGTTLSISPYKNHFLINELGKKLTEQHNIEFLNKDYKENHGYEKSIELGIANKFYRPTYSGCLPSKKDS
tara:strand:- start:166 stop:702 length:537 start_codon:yes stop_codon:yes gene_type:complete